MNIVILTGAGISVASGLRTFRGATGVYNSAEAERLAGVRALKDEPDAVWKFWGAIRAQALNAQPNAAHLAIAQLEQRLKPEDSLTVVTMNVDGLHRRAGSSNVIEMHGSLMHTRCHPGGHLSFQDVQSHQEGAPRCEHGHLMRPDVVFFGESLSPLSWNRAFQAARYAHVFIAVGTTNLVMPVAKLVKKPFYKGAKTIFVNPEIPLGLRCFRRRIAGKAEEVLPELLHSLVPGG